MAFNVLFNLTRSSRLSSNSSSVDAEEGELDESDIENGGEEEEEDSPDEIRHSDIVARHRSMSRSRPRSRPRPPVLETEIDDSGSDDADGDEESRPSDVLGWNDDLRPVEIEMFAERVGPRTENMALNHKSEPIQYFSLFFPDTLIETIAEQTNLYAVQKKDLSFKPVTSKDIQTFLYINMMFGIHQVPAYTHYWSLNPLLRVSQVADVMSRNRYQDISKYFHIADNKDMIPKGRDGYDPLFKIRPVLEAVKSASNSLFCPGSALSFDEAMIPFRGRLSFKQYIKGKPNPWGVKVWCVCDSATAFLLDFSFYTGKSDILMPNGLGYHTIWSLGQSFLRKHHHFYYDNFFSSVKLAQDLLDYDTYSCSTIRQNRKNWPADLKGNLEKGQYKMKQIGNLVACWWRDKRAISMLSTNASPEMGTAQRRTKDGPVEKNIPESVLVYNANMGGVDRHDQLRSYYPIGRKSHKWWRCCLWFLIEVAALNAYILYKQMPRPPGAPKPLDHFHFHLEIAKSLMKGSSRKKTYREAVAVAGLAVEGTSAEHRCVRLVGRKKQCYMCRQKDVRTASNKKPETVFGCSICNTHLCDELCFNQFHSKLN